MKIHFYLIVVCSIISSSAFAQGDRKLNKNFSFAVTGKMDTVASYKITQRVKRSGWGDVYGTLSQSLITNGFKVINEEYTSPHSYTIVIDYSRGFSAGKMQFSDLRGQILNSTGSETIGTFVYDGRFNPDDISVAIASKLKEIKPFIVKEEEVSTKQNTVKETPADEPIKGTSKESRLAELKRLYDKGVITKEEYESARKKIIEE
jgi:Short C-terminal domain